MVDAYGTEEQALGWYYYLEGKMNFPFGATCHAVCEISPLEEADEVEVIGPAKEDDCGCEMFVKIRWKKRGLAVPLSQLKPVASADHQTTEAIEDWHYWVGQGHTLC